MYRTHIWTRDGGGGGGGRDGMTWELGIDIYTPPRVK